MNRRAQVAAVVEELKRLKRSGVSAIAVSETALARLRSSLRSTPTIATSPATAGSGPGASATRPEAGERSPAAGSSLLDLVNAPATTTSRAAPVPTTATAAAKSSGKFPPPAKIDLPAGTKREQWEWLRRRVLDCPVCKAHTHGENQVVFGVGNIEADIFFCGEAPGGEEEIKGEPFVGPAGQVLTKMIIAMGLRREDVYIGNILNWRPEMEGRASGKTVHQTGNRPPTEEEMSFGLPYLRAQIAVVKPKVIVALGSTAAQGLLGFGSFKSLGSIRGRWLDFQGTPLMVTYHPSYLLRYADAKTKRIVWEDMLLVMEKVGLPITEKQRGFFK